MNISFEGVIMKEKTAHKKKVESMNSRQLQYAIILSETRNFSNAAQRLGMSQPAFSKHIIALEEELGVKLFERNTSPLSLTAAGEFFIKKARELLLSEESVIEAMDRYKEGEKGKIVIGIAPFRSLYIMPRLIAAMKERFPEIMVSLIEKPLAELKKDLLDGEMDFAIMNMPVTEPELHAVSLPKDTLVMAIPKKMLCLIDGNETPKRIKNLSKCAKVPFVTVGEQQEMRKLFEKLCAVSDINPEIYASVNGVTTAWEIVKAGLAATLVPRQFAQKEAAIYDIELIEIQQKIYVRQPAVVTREGQVISEHIAFATEVIKDIQKN